jgi:hypothetical protein
MGIGKILRASGMSDTPETVRIGPIDYKIEEVVRLTTADNTRLCGEIDYHNSVINLDTEQSPQSKRVTLWHEILHGILNNAGKSDHNEELIEIISLGIVGVLRDNPSLR